MFDCKSERGCGGGSDWERVVNDRNGNREGSNKKGLKLSRMSRMKILECWSTTDEINKKQKKRQIQRGCAGCFNFKTHFQPSLSFQNRKNMNEKKSFEISACLQSETPDSTSSPYTSHARNAVCGYKLPSFRVSNLHDPSKFKNKTCLQTNGSTPRFLHPSCPPFCFYSKFQ